MSLDFSYRHLYYFWVVGKEGGITRAAARLGMAVQTVSTQVRELERALGQSLLRPEGRGLALTQAGHVAMQQAEQIFALGEQLPDLLRNTVSEPSVRLVVGISDGVPKLVVRSLLQPLLGTPRLRLLCHEGEFDDLLADLALHRLDVVLSDRPAAPSRSMKLHSHLLGSSELAWYAPPALAVAARRGFPQSLAKVPVLLPTTHATARELLDQWFEREGVRPHTVAEFEDSALLKTFGAGGMGVFPAVSLVHDALIKTYEAVFVGACEGVEERFFAIAAQRKVQHPLVKKLLRS
ncbi:MAG: LysR family transcriptional regulator [Gammaproteobacteria bacterium]|nr:LysR family transcriptional regulator [Gammaproteobacteria bacterium]MBU1441008.1 LysR family transcriptional regulator [Gammaproteobacteria bacterium]MBU2288760.1 LysR family transcriptional regulator [Gammaproteobacteria bacterium]MBU2407216.1 LysR family transcriptional regulator [Gammaproteobacteria bacterium]